MTALELMRTDGQTLKVVVRQHGGGDLGQNPHIAAHEFTLLQLLQAGGVPAPRPCLFDESASIFPTPYVVVEYIEGNTEFAPPDLAGHLRQMAAHLSRIHAVDCSTLDLSFLPTQLQLCATKLRSRPAALDESLGERQIRDTLESVWPAPQQNRSVLLHGDFWPGNLLWRDEQLVGVIDWEDARLGDPLSDLANTRLEVLWASGLDAMHSFTDAYRRMTTIDFGNLACWDLWAALRPASRISEWAADAVTEVRMREAHHVFLAQALEQLAARHGSSGGI